VGDGDLHLVVVPAPVVLGHPQVQVGAITEVLAHVQIADETAVATTFYGERKKKYFLLGLP
jgi:hypothetical protein